MGVLALSDSLIDPQDPNIQPETEPATPARQDHLTQAEHQDSSHQADLSEEMPLPNFGPPGRETVGKTEPPSELEQGLMFQPEPEENQLEPTYKLSSAEPAAWSEFTTLPTPEAESDGPAPEEPNQSWKTAWAVIREVGETIILTLIIFLLIQTVIRNFRVVGTSMVDNLHDGQYLIIDKLSYNPLITGILDVGGPHRGDVIVFEPPNRPGEDYVKRIIGLPGETVEIRNGQVFSNGQPLPEPFQPGRMSYTMRPQVVPEGTVFVLGDNRNNSNDSHNWGPLPIGNIVGRAWLSYWPPDDWGTIPRDAPSKDATLKHFVEQLVPDANAGSN